MPHSHLKIRALAFGLFAGAAALSMATALPAQDSQSALQRDPSGWKEITPGADLKGWTRLPVPSTGTLGPQQWSVDPATGHLVCDGKGGHDWLRYDRELGDFIYHVEWRFFPVAGGKGYNSGVYVRNSQNGNVWHQAQVGDASGAYLFGMTMLTGQLTRINLSDQLKARRVRPAGEWNVYEVACRGRDIVVWANGGVTSSWSECQFPRGYVGLEAEGWKIEFRNLKVKELP